MGNSLTALLDRTAMLLSKDDDERTKTLDQLYETLDPKNPQTNKNRSRAVLNNKVVMDVLLSLSATTDVARSALLVLQRLAWNHGNSKRLFREHSSVVPVAMCKLEVGAENATENVQIKALGLLQNLAANNDDNAREIVIKNPTLVPLLIATVESNLEQVQIKALGVLQNLACNLDNAREMATTNPTLVPLLVAKVESNSEQVQIKALSVLQGLACNVDNVRDMVTKNPEFVPLLVAKVESNSEEVKIWALSVLQGLAVNVDNARGMAANNPTLVPLLVIGVGFKSEQVQLLVLCVLQNLAVNINNQREMFTKNPTLVSLLVAKVRFNSEKVQAKALKVLQALAYNVDNAREMATENFKLVPLLVAKVESESKQVQVGALDVLYNLARKDIDNARDMVTKNPTLVSLLVAKVGQFQVDALFVLQVLAVNVDNAREMVIKDLTLVPVLLAKVESNWEEVQARALSVLNNLAANVDNARKLFIKNSTLVPLVLAKMESESEQVQIKALSVLQGLAVNVDNGRDMVTKNPALVPLLVAKVGSNLEQVQIKALSVLQGLACSVDNMRKMVTNNPTLVPLLVTKVESNLEQMQVKALSMLQGLAFDVDNAREMFTNNSTLVSLLVDKMESNLEQVRVEALDVLQGLACIVDNKREMVTKNPTLVPLLVAKVEANSEEVQIKALGVLNNLAFDVGNRRELVTKNPKLVPLLVAKVESNLKNVQTSALGVLQNLAANVENARKMVTKSPTLVHLLMAKMESDSKQVQLRALNVLQRLAASIDNKREMFTKNLKLVPLLVIKVELNLEQVQIKALSVLQGLAVNVDNAGDMAAKNPTLVPMVVAKMESDSEEVRMGALDVLQSLAVNSDNAREMATKNPTLVSLLVAKARSNSKEVQIKALGVLNNLACNVDNQRVMAAKNPTLVLLLVAKVGSNLEQVQIKALDVLWGLAANVDKAREMVIASPTLVPLIMDKVESNLEEVQIKALGVLNNLAGDFDNKREMATNNPTLVPLLMTKVKSNSKQMQIKALDMLNSLTVNGDNAQEMVTQHPMLVPLLMTSLKLGNPEQVQQGALFVLQNLARNNARDMFTQHATLVLLVLALVESSSEEVQLGALEVLRILADNNNNAREMVTESPTLVPLLVAKAEANSEKVQVAALGVLQVLARNWKPEIKQKMTTLLVAKLGTDNSEQVQVASSVLQSLADNDENARDTVVKHATLVPFLLTMLAFAASTATTAAAAPFTFPVLPQALADALVNVSAELDVVLKFRALVDKVKVSTQQVRDKDALMDQSCGDRRVLESFQDLELDLTQLETQLGSEPFFAPPTPQQQAWIAKRNLVRSNLLSSTTRLKQAIFATKVAHLAEFNALKQQLGGAIDELDLFVQCNDNLFSPDSVCLESFKSSVIEVKQRELLHVFQVEFVQGSPRSAIDKVTKCYLELILLCKMRTRGEFDSMIQQAREVLQLPGVLSLTEERLESNEFVTHNEELQAKLERANQIIVETVKLRNALSKLRIKTAEHDVLRLIAIDSGQDVAGIEGELAILDATSKSIISKKNQLDQEMRYLASKPATSKDDVVCHFPELFHRVIQTWEAKPAGQALSKADEVKALLLKSDLLLPQGVAEYAGPTERMKLTMKNVQSLAIKGAVADGSGAQVVIKKVMIKDSLTEITKMKRILRASRIAAHPSILSCLGGIVVSEQEVNLVFPYMSGGDLAFWSQEQVRPVSRKLDVLTQVSDAIAALHRLDIFHRDIKPWNIVMDSSQDDAVPKLTDFEMSKEMGVAQTFNTTRGLLGTTQGFRAPEVGNGVSFLATDYGKQDVYSLGATAMWLLGDELAHSALITICTSHDANSRPSSKEVYSILSKRHCIVCLDDDVAFKDCVVCPDGAHCICKGCFDGWVKDQMQTELGRRKEIVACPSCTTNTPFPIRLYAHHIDLVLKARMEKVEVGVNQKVINAVAAALKTERELGAVALALRRIEEDLLISKCPQCNAAFADFDHCCALTCARCGIDFCAFCHQGASADAHSHVMHCVENPEEGNVFCDEDVYAAQQKAFKTKKLENFLETLDEVTRDRVRESAVVREYYQ